MKSKMFGALTAVTAAALMMVGCSGGGRGGSTSGASKSSVTLKKGDKIGVSLPWLGTQNWKEAQTLFTQDLKKAGFEPIVQAADNKVPQQQQQIESMVQQGVKAIVIGPVDGKQLGTVVEKAKAKGIYIFGYDRTIDNTDAVDGAIQYGSLRTGELQGQTLLDGLKAKKGKGPYSIEIFAGGPADPNAKLFYDGAMKVLKPKIDDGTLKVVSGQTGFTQAATQDWDNSKAQSRMDSILSGFYSGKNIDGVLAPNDGIARAIITSAEQAGKKVDVISGLDAENESVAWIAKGKQYSTVHKPTKNLVAKTIELLKVLEKGESLPKGDTTFNNGKKDLAIYQLDPIVVTKENAKKVFADDKDRLEIFNKNS